MKYFCVLFADNIKFVGENKLRIISLQVLPEDTSEKVKQGDKTFHWKISQYSQPGKATDIYCQLERCRSSGGLCIIKLISVHFEFFNLKYIFIMEDNFWWKTNFDVKRTFNERLLLLEDNLSWKIIFDGRWLLMENDQVYNCNGWRQPLSDASPTRWGKEFDRICKDGKTDIFLPDSITVIQDP